MKRNVNIQKKVIVTGSCGGIGESIVALLLEEGYFVIATGTQQSKLDTLKVKFEKFKENISTEFLDLNTIQSIQDFSDKIFSYGTIYGIVNNAGICIVEKVKEKKNFQDTVRDWENIIQVNLNSVFYLIKLNIEKIEKPGRIVNISSQLGKEGRAGFSAYCSSKFGLIGMTKCLAKELGRDGITVNAICPGWVDTEMAQRDLMRFAKEANMNKNEYYEKLCEPIELKRFTKPIEIAYLVNFLLSDRGGAITGRDFLIHTIWNER